MDNFLHGNCTKCAVLESTLINGEYKKIIKQLCKAVANVNRTKKDLLDKVEKQARFKNAPGILD